MVRPYGRAQAAAAAEVPVPNSSAAAMQTYLESRLLYLHNKLRCNVEEGAEENVVAQILEKINSRTFRVADSNSLTASIQDASVLGDDSKLQLASAILKRTRDFSPPRGRTPQFTTSAVQIVKPTYQSNCHSEHLGKVLSS